MMSDSVKVQRSFRRTIFWGLLIMVTAGLMLVALLAPQYIQLLTPTLQDGQVATQDYRAPTTISFTSEVLTEQRRETAVQAVPLVYTPPETSIARQQLERLRTALAYITSVREDNYATSKQKLDDLAALDDVHLSQETANTILELSDSRWQTVQQEAIVVLEQVMRSSIRSDRVEEARNSLPTMVSLSLTEQQANVVAELAAAFVAPNSLYSESLTESARQAASQAIKPVTRTYIAGETVVQRGQVLDAADVEALRSLGLVTPDEKWQDLAAVAGLVLLMIAFLGFYIRRKPALLQEVRSLVLIVVLFLGFLLTARLTMTGHTIIPYAFPLVAYGLIVAAMFGAQQALISLLPLAIMAAYGLPNALDLTLYYTLTGLFGVLALGRARRLTSFFWAGIAIALSGVVIVLVYHLPQPTMDWVGLATLSAAALFNGLASASLTVLLQFFLAQILGMTTPMQLMELTRPDHPLLQMILREAPGTYQHSLQVANLAEQAAERIGADTLLTRVGALYHDVGKSVNPVFFIENQVPGFLNPHDDLDPVTSAATIIRHVTDGLELAHKYRLPKRICDFISEHHGSMTTRYQYVNAVKAVGGDESLVDAEQFRYPGPRPRTRETAILMLADGSEARVRAEKPMEEEELRELVKGVIDNRVAIGQLDDTDLTLHDLNQILESFTVTLRGIYHPRVKYPKLEAARSISEETVPVNSLPVNLQPNQEAPLGSSSLDHPSTVP